MQLGAQRMPSPSSPCTTGEGPPPLGRALESSGLHGTDGTGELEHYTNLGWKTLPTA